MSVFRRQQEVVSQRLMSNMRQKRSAYSLPPADAFSYEGKKTLASFWGDFVHHHSHYEDNNIKLNVRADLTLKQGRQFYNRELNCYDNIFITEALAVYNIGEFLNKLNYDCYKHAYKRYGKKINITSCIEGGDANTRENMSKTDEEKRLHAHLLLERPKHMSVDDFEFAIIKRWRESSWGYDWNKIEEINSIYSSSNYNMKSGADSLDTENTHFKY